MNQIQPIIAKQNKKSTTYIIPKSYHQLRPRSIEANARLHQAEQRDIHDASFHDRALLMCTRPEAEGLGDDDSRLDALADRGEEEGARPGAHVGVEGEREVWWEPVRRRKPGRRRNARHRRPRMNAEEILAATAVDVVVAVGRRKEEGEEVLKNETSRGFQISN